MNRGVPGVVHGMRSLFLQAAWNPKGMQNVGFAFAIRGDDPATGRAQSVNRFRRADTIDHR